MTLDDDEAFRHSGERDVDLALSDLEQQELNGIAAALDRVVGESFGLCVDCGGAIPFDRLRIEPQALRCVPCESLRERGA